MCLGKQIEEGWVSYKLSIHFINFCRRQLNFPFNVMLIRGMYLFSSCSYVKKKSQECPRFHSCTYTHMSIQLFELSSIVVQLVAAACACKIERRNETGETFKICIHTQRRKVNFEDLLQICTYLHEFIQTTILVIVIEGSNCISFHICLLELVCMSQKISSP